jgi:type IV pilus assembly protein PilY1
MKRLSIADRVRAGGMAAVLAALITTTQAATPLADQPVFSAVPVPGNMALALSVEFPTAVSVAHQGKFVPGASYLGYFDTEKCYKYYVGTETGTDLSHFYPVSKAAGRKCNVSTYTDTWSGNFLNWLMMQAIDPFRGALTGGYRVVDTPTTTILERAWATANSLNGGDTNFPLVPTSDGNALKERPSPTATEIADHTPLSFGSIKVSVRTRGNQVLFTNTGTLTSNTPSTSTATHYPGEASGAPTLTNNIVYHVYARVKVCDSGVGVEANCKSYASGYKPEGLMQEYAERIRFSAFGYLNDPTDNIRDGGVLRARQKFVGPMKINPGSAPTANVATEWDASTGVMKINPDNADATATATAFGVPVANSGVINYLNKFGQQEKSYKRRDPVSELYYAALRYLKNQGNVPAWTDIASDSNKARLIDGFPVITTWDDPLEYSCQKNFILGIGDTNTNWDRNVPGSSGGGSEPSMPSQVSSDNTVNAVTATNTVGTLQGLGGSLGTTGISNGSYLIAGLAYDSNIKDIRPDDATKPQTKGKQTVQTYWLDVLEFGDYVANNQYYLAAKYGGFNAPDSYVSGGALTEAWWYTTTETVGAQKRPDTYYTVAKPEQMVAGLTKAFASIASKLTAYTTSFSTSLPQISTIGVASYSTQFDAKNWTGELVASKSNLDADTGEPSLTESWRFSSKLDAQALGNGWDTERRIVTYNTGTTPGGVPFRISNLSTAQVLALDTYYRSGDDSADYLNYLRGERKHERSSTAAGTSNAYRDRTTLLGDIVGSKSRPVGKPDAPYSSAANPGYAAFKETYKNRKAMVYVGTNRGMLHAVDGSLDAGPGKNPGQEVFAYVPGALYAGTTGLSTLGNPNFQHFNFVDATPLVADVDFGKTVGGSVTDWRTILVGGLGKGGKSLYAIDVTDPSAMTSESAVAGKVLWEFSHPKLGYTYGEPALVKTKKYGWVLIFGSGYNNSDGQGYFFIVNPRTGELITADPIGTGEGSTGDDAGLAHVQAFMLDRTDGTADSVYAGDLHGNLWRLDLTDSAGNYPAPTKIATLTDGSDVRLPVTSRPLVVIQPKTNRRYVTVGTGRLLHSSDIGSAQAQRYFAIIDGSGVRFNKSTDLPTGIGGFPITRAKLKQLTDLTKEINLDLSTQIGWYVDLGQVAGGSGWRVISDSTSFLGVVAFTAMVPSEEAACEASGVSRVYAIDLGTGASRLKSGNTVIAYSASPKEYGVVTDLRFYSVAGKPRLLAGYDSGKNKPLPGDWTPTVGLRRLNWREVPLTD